MVRGFVREALRLHGPVANSDGWFGAEANLTGHAIGRTLSDRCRRSDVCASGVAAIISFRTFAFPKLECGTEWWIDGW